MPWVPTSVTSVKGRWKEKVQHEHLPKETIPQTRFCHIPEEARKLKQAKNDTQELVIKKKNKASLSSRLKLMSFCSKGEI